VQSPGVLQVSSMMFQKSLFLQSGIYQRYQRSNHGLEQCITILNIDKNVMIPNCSTPVRSKRPNTLECKSYARAGRTTAQYFTSLYVVVDSLIKSVRGSCRILNKKGAISA